MILLAGLWVLQSCRQKAPSPQKDEWATYRLGYQFFSTNRDSAFFYFNKVVTNVRDSNQVAMAFHNMAILQSDAGDYFGSQESLIQALQYIHKQDGKQFGTLAAHYNELAANSLYLKNYQDAIEFSQKALSYTQERNFRSTILNNQAAGFRGLKQYSKAITIYQSLLQADQNQNSAYARLLTNLVSTRWLLNPSYPAAGPLLQALQIREREKDLWGQSSSYSHLSDYYRRSAPDSAFVYASRMYTAASKLRNPDEELQALSRLTDLAPATELRKYATRYQELSDSVQTARNAAKNQFALIRYQSQEQKADNLRLQRDNAEKSNQLNKQRFLSAIIFIVLVAGGVTSWLWFKRRQERMKLEREKAVQEKEYQILKSVHDVVANGLYRLMKRVQNREQLPEAELITHLDQLYERSRTLSYGQAVHVNQFHEEVALLVSSFADEDTRIFIAGNESELWANSNNLLQNVVLDTLLELMVNMDKHSQASQVAVKFERQEQQLIMTYHDNGVGLPTDVQFGNGLTSTGNRIHQSGGQLIFDQRNTGGLQVNIILPLP